MREKRYLNKIFIGLAYGTSFPLTIVILDYWLKDIGMSNVTIGVFSFIHLPFMLKFLWGTAIENQDIPFLSKKIGRGRSWLVLSYFFLIVGTIVIAFSSPENSVSVLIFGASLVALSDGCKNIVMYTYQLMDCTSTNLGFIASYVNLGHNLGSIFMKVAMLHVAHFYGWRCAYLFASCVLLAVMTVILCMEAPSVNPDAEKNNGVYSNNFLKKTFDFLLNIIRQKDGRKIIGMVCLFKSADFMMQKMSKLFCLEIGFSKIEIANTIQFYGSVMAVIGSFLGGYLVQKRGLRRSMPMVLLLHAISFLSYLLLIRYGKSTIVLTFVTTVEALSGGAVTACFIAFFYTVASGSTAYALLWALHEFSGMIFMALSGTFVSLIGWKLFFCLAPLLAIPPLRLLKNFKF